MAQNFLKLNDDKTEFLIISSEHKPVDLTPSQSKLEITTFVLWLMPGTSEQYLTNTYPCTDMSIPSAKCLFSSPQDWVNSQISDN
jgi:hypothetical protein